MEAHLLSADSDTSVEDFAWVSDLIDVLGMSFFDKGISKVRIISRLNHLIGQIDAKLRAQVDEVLHHPLFQSLEATWSGCRYLLDELAFSQQIKVRLLDITWSELHRDITRAIDIEHSEIFHKVYNAEFGMAGGEPFGAMLCDYPVALTAKTAGVDDLRVVRGLASVAAASFCPFLFNADPSLLDLDDFAKLHSGIDLNRTYQQESFIKWKSLRSIEDARFIGLTLPYLYIRRQYRPNRFRTDGFVYREGVKGRGDFLKIGSVFAMGVVMARCFSNTGWLAEITGKRYFGGGVVPGLKVHTSPIDGHAQFAAEVMIADSLERSLSEHGFIPVCYSVNSAKGVFYSAASIQSPLAYKASAARANARYSAMLQYVLCTARFAHYMKVIVRDSVGSFSTTEECRNFLQTWIMNYVMSTDEASEILLSQYPLREARVQVNERAGTSGSYMCTVHLKPHFQLESIETSIQFSAEVVSSRVAG